MRRHGRENSMQSRTLCVATVAVFALICGCSQQMEPAVPELAVTSTFCATDLSCPFGYECVDGVCVPIAASLYDHIQTASILLRAPIDGAETAWRATHYDLMIGGLRPDEIRPLNPNARLFDYTLTRYHRFEGDPGSASAWAVAHGWNPEDFYLHYREDVYVPTWEGRVIVPGFPPGMVPGWNPGGGGGPASATQRSQSRVVGYFNGEAEPWHFGNLAHPGYRQFFAERIAGLIDGTWYQEAFATGPLDGIMCDEAIFYAVFGEGLLDRSTEYYGIPMTAEHPYALLMESLYPFLAEVLLSAIGSTEDVMANYGHVLFLNYPNRSAINVQATTPWILGEVWVAYTGRPSPVSGATRCVTYDKDYANAVREIVRQTREGGRRVLGAFDSSNGLAGTGRGKLFTLGLYYLVHNRHTYYVYESADQSPNHLSTWGWNPAVPFDVGQPASIPPGAVDFEGNANTREHWEFATGADPYQPQLTYRVLARRFTNALVLVKMLPLGSVDDNRSITTHPLDRPYRVLQVDGTLGLTVTEARLRNNEALILIPETSTGVD
jgi:hypothetical protein